MAKKEVKVKSYRTKDGKRVKQFRRRIKIAAGVAGVAAVGALVLAAKNKKVVTPIDADNPTPRARSIGTRVKLKNRRPRRVTTLKNTQEWADTLEAQKGLKGNKPKVKPKTTVAEVRQTVAKPKVTVDSKELETLKEINDALNSGEVGKDSIGVLRQEKREIADRIRGKSKPKTNKFLDQALTGQGYQPKPKPNVIDERIARIERQQKWDAKRGVVLRRKKLLEESLGKKVVDKTKGRLDFNPTPKSRKARKKAAKQLADAAKDLRSRGAYV